MAPPDRAPGAGRPHSGYRWPRAPFLANMLLIGGFLVVALGVSALAFYHFAQRPRAQMLAGMYAAQLASVTAAMNQLPGSARDNYLKRLDVLSDGNIAIDDPLGWRFGEPPASLAREFLYDVRRRLPGHRVEFSTEPSLQLWVEIVAAGDHGRWIRMPLSQFATMPPGVLLAGFLAVVVLTFGGTTYLVARSRKKLSWIGAAIDQVGTTPFPATVPLPVDAAGDDDLADLRLRFNEMSARLAEAQAERAIMLAGVSHDMRTLLTKLRLCLALDPATSALTAPVRYIEHMDRIIGQFVEFARPVDEEPAVRVDLNQLVVEVAADFTPEDGKISLALGAVPLCAMRPLAVRRMVMNLIENAVRHGGGAVEVITAQEDESIVVRVLDRGLGVAMQELDNLARPFFRTAAARGRCAGSGLGLAISRRMAESHGGSLLLGLRAGGGFRAEIRLPMRAGAAPKSD